jgi:hypothetical protein
MDGHQDPNVLESRMGTQASNRDASKLEVRPGIDDRHLHAFRSPAELLEVVADDDHIMAQGTQSRGGGIRPDVVATAIQGDHDEVEWDLDPRWHRWQR